MIHSYLWTIFFCYVLVSLTSQAFFGNKYTMEMETAFLCPENDQLEVPMSLVRVDRINRTHRAISADFTIKHPIDDKVEATIYIEKWGNSGWLKLSSIPWQKDPCGYGAKIDREVTIAFLKCMGFANATGCPVPAGNYSVHNYVLDFQHAVPFWNGRFRNKLLMRTVDTKKNFYCLMYIINVVEKID